MFPEECDTTAEHGGQNPQASFLAQKDATRGSCFTGISDIIVKHGGWNTRTENLFVVNGEFDPGRSASLSSRGTSECEKQPGQPVEIIKGGHYCWDWDLRGGECDMEVRRVVDLGITRVKGWLAEWYEKHRVENRMPKETGTYWKDVLPLKP